jgi:hypothetical protein
LAFSAAFFRFGICRSPHLPHCKSNDCIGA